MMKIIFLDIDGVLINLEDCLDPVRRARIPGPERVDLLNQILDATDARIVVSSAWRIGRSQNELQFLLTSWGVNPGHVIGKTGNGLTRGEEIQEWLRDNRAENHQFVIIDDDVFDMGELRPQAVKTQFDTGLTPQIASEVIRRLNKKTIQHEAQ